MTEAPVPSPTYEFGHFRLDPARRLLTRTDGRAVELASKAFDALVYLVAHAGTAATRAELSAALWPRTIVEDNSLSKLIVALRRSLGEDDEHRYIATLPGRGYQFVAVVRRLPAGPDTGSATPQLELPGAAGDRRTEPAQPPLSRPRFAFAGALVLAGGVAAAAFGWLWLAPAGLSTGVAGSGTALGSPVRAAPITAYAGYELAPTLSPDGESVAFSWDGDNGNRNLYVTRIGSSGASPLTAAAEPDRFPAWSSGGDIAFLREMGPESFELFVVPAAGGRERRIRSVRLRPTAVYSSPVLTWTRASEAVVFTTRSGDDVAAPHHLYKLTIASGENVQLTFGDNVYDTSPAVSPDGRWLAFVRHDGSSVHARGTLLIQPLAPDGAARQPIVVPVPSAGSNTPAYVIHSPSWSRDGRYLTFVVGTDLFEWEQGATATRLVYAGAGRLGGLTLAGDLAAVAMVRDGRRARVVLASIDRSSDLFSLPVAANREARGAPVARFSSSAGDIHPRFSPDGRRVAFVSDRDGRSDIWVAALAGGEAWRATDLESAIVGFPRWSPDGTQIAFHALRDSERQVYVVAPDVGAPRRVAAGCCLEWSGDGHLYVTDLGAEHAISRVRVADGHRERLFAGGFPGLTLDGSRLLYGKVGETNLYARAVAGDLRHNAEELVVTDAAYPSAIAAADDGFFYVRYSPAGEPGQIRFYEYETRQARVVANVPTGVAELLSLSPDGTELMYSAQRASGADLWLLEFGEPW